MLQGSEVLDALEIGNALAANVLRCAVVDIGLGDIALGIEAEQIVAEIGVGEVSRVDDGHIVVADINILIIDLVTAGIIDGAIAIIGSVWLQDGLIPIEIPVLTIINNRITGIIGGLESHATACFKIEKQTLDDTVSSRRQNGIHIIKIHIVPYIHMGGRAIFLILDSRIIGGRDIECSGTLNSKIKIIPCRQPDTVLIDTGDVDDSACRRGRQRGSPPDADHGSVPSIQVAGATEFDFQIRAFQVVDDTIVVARHGDSDIVHVQGVGAGSVIHHSARDVVAHDVVAVVTGHCDSTHRETIVGGRLCCHRRQQHRQEGKKNLFHISL